MTGYLPPVGYRDLRVISGPSRDQSWRVDSRSILDPFWTLSWTLSRKPHQSYRKGLHLAVGRASALNILIYGSWDGLRVGTRYSPPSHPPTAPPRVHPPYTTPVVRMPGPRCPRPKYGRGAQIRRPTLFRGRFLRVPGYYRGL